VTEDVFFKFDFLDPVKNDLPKGCWSLQSDPSKTKVNIPDKPILKSFR
jgi:hypothetical protein